MAPKFREPKSHFAMSVFIPPRELRALAAAGAAMLIGTLILQQFPALELFLFAAGAARLTGF